MRAFTRLAGHIPGSYPRINGCFEMHISYEDTAALDKQLGILPGYETLKQHSHYLFNRLLHNDCRQNMRAGNAENALHPQIFQESYQDLAYRYLHEYVAATAASVGVLKA